MVFETVTDHVPGLVDQYLFDSIDRRRQNSREICAQIGSPVRLLYPSGGFDLYQLQLPSSRVLAIADVVPLLIDQPTQINQYSHRLVQTLRQRKGNYMSLEEMLDTTEFNEDERAALVTSFINASKSEHNRVTDGEGFQRNGTRFMENVDYDNFANTLAVLTNMGVDLRGVKIGVFGDSFRLNFDVDGVNKTVLLMQTELDTMNGTARRDSDINRWLRHCFDGFDKGPTAVVVKADIVFTSEYVIDAVEPDIVFGSIEESPMKHVRDHLQSRYDFFLIDPETLPFPNLKWGYGKAGNIAYAWRKGYID